MRTSLSPVARDRMSSRQADTVRALAFALALTSAAAAAACASKQRGPAAEPPADSTTAAQANRAARHQADVITAEEIRAAFGSASNAYDLIKQLRPNFLQSRGVRPSGGNESSAREDVLALNGARIYLDGTYFGSIAMLREISVNTIAQIRYYSATAAAMRFGQQETASPVIHITTIKR
ncbi:MAG TPA: hypothetical protein VKA84_06830 [Gemmatimonadaceae bacterium]|nr:hypothetical protein [Gemmatimonadaceae bacterium]